MLPVPFHGLGLLGPKHGVRSRIHTCIAIPVQTLPQYTLHSSIAIVHFMSRESTRVSARVLGVLNSVLVHVDSEYHAVLWRSVQPNANPPVQLSRLFIHSLVGQMDVERIPPMHASTAEM